VAETFHFSAGGIQPFMHVRSGTAPKAKIEMYRFNPDPDQRIITDSLTFGTSEEEPLSCIIRLVTNDKEEKHTLLQEEWRTLQSSDWKEEIG
jgi:hypothetical protein